ncbi:16S rRNA processing protein RimM [Marchantia polymorpha subsp. ruderalis]
MAMALRSTCARVPGPLQEFVFAGSRGHAYAMRIGCLHAASASSPALVLSHSQSYRLLVEKFVFSRLVSRLNVRSKPSPAFQRRVISSFASPILETEVRDSGDFVEVGYIADTHGVHGELHVYSLTDFPEERFETPGKRWVRSKAMGKHVYHEVELLQGREVGGKRPSWLIKLKGFNSIEKASDLVGSTLVVTERPSLSDDEFYIPDLVGMAVILQESGQEIGVIVDVYNTGGDTDLLQVKRTDGSSSQKIWIPFVKEIVPIVDKDGRRVEINPPAGLLELNSPGESKDEKVKRKQELKEKRKVRERFAGLKKRLTAIGQTHILEGLLSGTESQQQDLVNQLLSIDFASFQRALQDVLPLPDLSPRQQGHDSRREPPSAFPCANWQELHTWLDQEESSTENGDVCRWWTDGLQLIADGRVAVVVLAGGQSTRLGDNASTVKGSIDLGLVSGKSLFQLQAERLLIVQELAKLVTGSESRPCIPWIVMTSDATDEYTQAYFEDNEFFGLDSAQVWFVKQDSMPCIDLDMIEDRHRILLETPWKVAQAPGGNGGLFTALNAQGIIDRLAEEGVDYVQVYAVDNALVRVADPVFFGYTNERGADIGVKVVTKTSPDEAVGVVCINHEMVEEEGSVYSDTVNYIDKAHYSVLEYSQISNSLKYATEDTIEGRQLKFRAAHICVNIFSLSLMKMLGLPKNELQFHPVSKKIKHVKQQGKEWVEVIPERPNGVKLERFIFDSFKFCDLHKVALLEVRREDEFAPVKNAAAPEVSDTVNTARCMINSLISRLPCLSLSKSDSQLRQLVRNLNLAYMGGSIEANISDFVCIDETEQSEL